jgi:glycosyltransferase involved in cell wall biosynthesis
VLNSTADRATTRLLAYLAGVVRVIETQGEQNAARLYNQAATVAKGEYLALLSSDALVLGGWLKRLEETLTDPTVGAAGSMQLYADGRLAEAGGIVWADGTTMRYGANQADTDSRFSYARAVDYCSANALLLRKSLLDRLGGFDEQYGLGRYEHIDFCMGVRALGYQVLYQPLSRVVCQTADATGATAHHDYQLARERSRQSFVEKWRERLPQEHCAYQPARVEQAADRRHGPRVIVFDHNIPTPDRDAGSVRMALILETLAKWGQPVFVPLHPRYPTVTPAHEAALARAGVEIVQPLNYAATISQRRFAAAILSRPDIADQVLATIRKADPRVKIIYDTVDVFFLRHQREYLITGDKTFAQESAKYKKVELRLARSSDQVWCVSDTDAEVIKKELPAVNIKIVPTIHEVDEAGKAFDEREGLLFIGNYIHRPNKDAVHYFMKEILPRLRPALPEVNFYIAGSHMPDELIAYRAANVIPLGYVPEVVSLFHSSRVFIAPLRFGAGVKGKIGHALSHGLPVVTTTIGAEGMGLRHGVEAMIVDSAEQFAEAIIQTYQNRELWQQLSIQGRLHIQKHFTPEVIGEEIRRALTELDEARGALSA